jgi:hypothetical protein
VTNIVAFEPVVPDARRQAPKRLKTLSRGLVLLFTLLLGLMALNLLGAVIIGLFFPDYVLMTADSAALLIGPHGAPPAAHPGMVRLSDLPRLTHLAGIADIAIAVAPIAFILWHLRALFGLYAAGIVFAPRNAAHLRAVGLGLIAYPFARFAANLVFRTAGGTDHGWFRPGLLWVPLAGLIIVAIAWVMEFGRDIEEEKDSFI